MQMEDKKRCQSCGMPIDAAFANLGTEIDGTPATDYCTFCFQIGEFTDPELTLDDMIQASVDFMTKNLSFTPEMAAKMSNDIIPQLRRWNSLN